MANCYFLLIVVLELFNSFAEAFISFVPLAIVVSISMVKDIIEDRARYRSDQEENDRTAHFSMPIENKFEDVQAREIKIGRFVKVYNDENFPCDLLMVNSSLPKGISYVETKGLDGETNLKMKMSRPETIQMS
jgi:P-type E1-E2 ATPase